MRPNTAAGAELGATQNIEEAKFEGIQEEAAEHDAPEHVTLVPAGRNDGDDSAVGGHTNMSMLPDIDAHRPEDANFSHDIPIPESTPLKQVSLGEQQAPLESVADDNLDTEKAEVTNAIVNDGDDIRNSIRDTQSNAPRSEKRDGEPDNEAQAA